jgi:hypothetical protein
MSKLHREGVKESAGKEGRKGREERKTYGYGMTALTTPAIPAATKILPTSPIAVASPSSVPSRGESDMAADIGGAEETEDARVVRDEEEEEDRGKKEVEEAE